MSVPIRRLVLLAAAALVAACSSGDESGPHYPPETVLVVSGVPITPPEVDRIADRLQLLNSTFTRPHLRRLALTNSLFPMISARRLGREAHPEARREAQAFRAAQTEGGMQGPLPALEEGHWKSFGLEVWMQLTQLEPGVWSEVFEEPGAFVVARLHERDHAERTVAEIFRADVLKFPYYPSRVEIDQAVFDESLEILDPEWERIVPTQWQLEMTGEP